MIARGLLALIAVLSLTIALAGGAFASAGATPTVTAVTPSSGPTVGGTNVTIVGTGFTAATAVTIGGAAATSVTVVSDTEIKAVTSAHVAGLADVAVTAANATGTRSGLYTYNLATPQGGCNLSLPYDLSQSPVYITTIAGQLGFGQPDPTGTISYTFSGPTGIIHSATLNLTGNPAGSGRTSAFDAINIAAPLPNGTYTISGSYSGNGYYSPTSCMENFVVWQNPASSVASLSSLSLSQGTLSPAFASGTTSYTASVGNGVTSLTVTPVLTDSSASVTVNGAAVTSGSASGPLPLAVGPNTIHVVVTAQDGTTTDSYQVVVTRAALPALTTQVSVPSTAGTIGAALTPFKPVTASGGFGTLTYAISPALPSGLAFDGTTAQISGTPKASLATTTFTITASDSSIPTPQKSSQTFTLTINKASTSVVLTAPSASLAFGVSVTLTATVSGGQIPTGSIVFLDGRTSLGTVPLVAGLARLTSNTLTAGQHVLTAVYGGDGSNAGATSAPLSLSIAARPNPATDPGVTGLVTAQVQAATQFAQTQISNTQSRLEQIHDEQDSDASGAATSAQNVARNNSGTQGSSVRIAEATGVTNAGAFGASGGSGSVMAYAPDPAAPTGAGAAEARGAILTAVSGWQDTGSGRSHNLPAQDDMGRLVAMMGSAMPGAVDKLNRALHLPFHIWAADAFQFGTLQNSGSYDNRFSTSGLTIGLDRRFTRQLTAGLSIGAGLDHTAVKDDGTGMNSTSLSAALYGSYRLARHSFVDLVGGYGRLGFETQRWSPAGNVFLHGSRKGSEFFAAATFTQDLKLGRLKLSPYGRLQAINVRLDPYAETGSSTWALDYASVNTTSVSAVLGTRIVYPIAMSWGLLTPSMRFEYSHALGGAYAQDIAYADLTRQTYTFSGIPVSTDIYTAGLMLKAQMRDMLSLDLEYDFSVSGQRLQGNTIRFALRQQF